jgi:hypothetical protein
VEVFFIGEALAGGAAPLRPVFGEGQGGEEEKEEEHGFHESMCLGREDGGWRERGEVGGFDW